MGKKVLLSQKDPGSPPRVWQSRLTWCSQVTWAWEAGQGRVVTHHSLGELCSHNHGCFPHSSAIKLATSCEHLMLKGGTLWHNMKYKPMSPFVVISPALLYPAWPQAIFIVRLMAGLHSQSLSSTKAHSSRHEPCPLAASTLSSARRQRGRQPAQQQEQQSYQDGHLLAAAFTGKTWSGRSWVLTQYRKECLPWHHSGWRNDAKDSLGCPCYICWSMKTQAPCGGSTGLGRSCSTGMLAGSSLAVEGPHLWFGDTLPWSECSSPGKEKLCWETMVHESSQSTSTWSAKTSQGGCLPYHPQMWF